MKKAIFLIISLSANGLGRVGNPKSWWVAGVGQAPQMDRPSVCSCLTAYLVPTIPATSVAFRGWSVFDNVTLALLSVFPKMAWEEHSSFLLKYAEQPKAHLLSLWVSPTVTDVMIKPPQVTIASFDVMMQLFPSGLCLASVHKLVVFRHQQLQMGWFIYPVSGGSFGKTIDVVTIHIFFQR